MIKYNDKIQTYGRSRMNKLVKKMEVRKMGMESIKRPLWVCKLSDDKLKQYLDALNNCKAKKYIDNELLLHTLYTWYSNQSNKFGKLANDIYKEAAARWYDQN